MPEPVPAGTTSSNRVVMIVLSYLWILALVPLLVEKDDQEIQWHAKHGIVLMVTFISLSMLNMVLAFMMPLGRVFVGLQQIAGLLFLCIHIAAIVKGLNGQRLIIPGLSEYASRF